MIMQQQKKNLNKPPIFAEKILRFMLSSSEREGFSGDFEEIYNDYLEESGKTRAWLWYWGQIQEYFPRFIINLVFWEFNMFKNYLKIAFRNIKIYKGYAFINISGFAIGIACCMLILIYVQHELSYDRYHKKNDRIYRVARWFCVWGINFSKKKAFF